MSAASKAFTFNDVFDDHVKDPMVSLRQEYDTLVDIARQQAFEEGRCAGIEEARLSYEAIIASHLDRLTQDLEIFHEDQQKQEEQILSHAIEIGGGMVRAMLPVYAERGALDEITAMIASVVEGLSKDLHMTIRVHPHIEKNYAERLRDIAARESIVIQGDDTLDMSDCKIQWETGGVERLSSNIQQKLDAILGDLVCSLDDQASIKKSIQRDET
jgi:flagellar assembly protein FliH